MYFNSNQNLKRKHCWATQPCRPGQYINRNQQRKNRKNIYRATVYITSTVYQPRLAKQKHIWRSCISTARYINRDQQSKSISGAAVYINSNHKTKRKHRWTTRPCRPVRYINLNQQSKSIPGADVYQQHGIPTAISSKKHIWRNCISTARNINRNKHSGSISGAAVYQQPSNA